ncbi:hypothetical protein AAFF_G00432980 [Aldrovandia affinis]|uniref:Uncharacterized protein n=1 Tax=Aldrovandia affinis TaxID=143900 RepID=A0AAD7S8H0_9TELE|nr:hypothetical protein AAFF_G00432980 [Aldrovandia affinis]
MRLLSSRAPGIWPWPRHSPLSPGHNLRAPAQQGRQSGGGHVSPRNHADHVRYATARHVKHRGRDAGGSVYRSGHGVNRMPLFLSH